MTDDDARALLAAAEAMQRAEAARGDTWGAWWAAEAAYRAAANPAAVAALCERVIELEGLYMVMSDWYHAARGGDFGAVLTAFRRLRAPAMGEGE